MSRIIDRRLNGKNKSAVNRQRFIRRYKNQIKYALNQAVNKRSITDIQNGENIYISSKDIKEPYFHHGPGGYSETVHPGNTDFIAGDVLQRPPKQDNQGIGKNASPSPNISEDDFVFELSREEFFDLLFEDLVLPDLIKKQLQILPNYKTHRAGFTTTGTPTNINIGRSFKTAIGRRIALSAPYKIRLMELQQELLDMQAKLSAADPKIKELCDEISLLQKKLWAIPYIDKFDLRYNYRVKAPYPSSQAVMFCIMDVSGSMDEEKKDLAKRLFTLLYLFLSTNYQHIEVVFIRHHTLAKEVNEQEFFYSRETGGTVVSSALELLKEIVNKRYSPQLWNLYAAQASDGDNWYADSPRCQELLSKDILPAMQYYAYVEINPHQHQSLWEAYFEVQAKFTNFAMRSIETAADIYPVFHDLFKRQLS